MPTVLRSIFAILSLPLVPFFAGESSRWLERTQLTVVFFLVDISFVGILSICDKYVVVLLYESQTETKIVIFW